VQAIEHFLLVCNGLTVEGGLRNYADGTLPQVLMFKKHRSLEVRSAQGHQLLIHHVLRRA